MEEYVYILVVEVKGHKEGVIFKHEGAVKSGDDFAKVFTEGMNKFRRANPERSLLSDLNEPGLEISLRHYYGKPAA